jgi:type 1 glutamine amidotransferase
MRKMFAVVTLLTMAQAAANPHRPAASYDRIAPVLPTGLHRAVLIFSKTNGWRHIEHIPHSNIVLSNIAYNLGRSSYVTENAAVFNDKQLPRFSVVVLNSASGDFLTREQRASLSRFIARGGGVVALHAAGDGSHTNTWYNDTILGTKYIGHPGAPEQFQKADILINSPRHPIMAGVKLPWSPTDEWYSFNANPADRGMTVIAQIDEKTYHPSPKLAMVIHPIIWINPSKRGRIVYSALGHSPETYDDPNYRRVLVNAVGWAAKLH